MGERVATWHISTSVHRLFCKRILNAVGGDSHYADVLLTEYVDFITRRQAPKSFGLQLNRIAQVFE